MNIILIGPGILPIPPKGWGAVEILIWDYYQELKNLGHKVEIINTPYRKEIIDKCNRIQNLDFVHIHYDVFCDIIPFLKCKNIGISSHYPYIDQPERYQADGYNKIFNFMVQNENFNIFAISKKDYDIFFKYCKNKDNIFILENGIRNQNINFKEIPNKPNLSVCLGRIDNRKRQYLLKNLNHIDIIGCSSDSDVENWSNYKGEWTREQIKNDLTDYGNMILLSNGENGTPLVIKEALMAGLGVIITKESSHELDLTKKFIDLIPEEKIKDIEYINKILLLNKDKSLSLRNEIRKYAEEEFGFKKFINIYINNINKIKNYKMKIVIVGPGLMPIPPKGWGAVEILIWDYYLHLKNKNCNVHIVNQSQPNLMIQEINNHNPDIVHIQYDDYIYIVPYLNCKRIIYTTHWAYLTRDDILPHVGYFNFFKKAIEYKDRIHLFALSTEISNVYIKYGFPKEKIKIMFNGANDKLFRYDEICKYPNKSIYLAKIDDRKSQYKYQSFDFIDFVGNKSTTKFDYNLKNYLGEWDKNKLYNNLTDYANLVLLSDGEAHPLVVCEALVCGLGVVVSSYASANLDQNLEWITIIPDDKLNDLEFVKNKIIENQKISVLNRQKIREYGIKKFSWTNRIDDYISNIETLFNN
jgi:hypothetical protein